MVLTPAGASLSLAQAREQGLIQLMQQRTGSIVISDNHTPVTLKVAGKGISFEVRSLTSAHKGNFGGSGAPEYFGPVSGTVSLAEAGSVLRNGKRLKPVRTPHAPRTTARVKRHGSRYTVTLRAHGAASTYYRLGKGRSRRYSGPLHVNIKQLRSLRFASVNNFGRWKPDVAPPSSGRPRVEPGTRRGHEGFAIAARNIRDVYPPRRFELQRTA